MRLVTARGARAHQVGGLQACPPARAGGATVTSVTPAVEVGALRMVVAGNGIKCPQTATFRGFSCDKSPLSFGFPLQFAGDTGDKLKN